MSERRPPFALAPPNEALPPGDLIERHRCALALDRQQRTRPARGPDPRGDLPDKSRPGPDALLPKCFSPMG